MHFVGRGTEFGVAFSGSSASSSGGRGSAEFNLLIGFFDEKARVPDELELQALMIQLNLFFTQKIQIALNDPSASISVNVTEWHYQEGSETPVSLQLDVQAMRGDGTSVTPHGVYQALKLESEDLSTLITDFVQKATLTNLDETIFVQTNQIKWESHTMSATTSSTGPSVGKSARSLFKTYRDSLCTEHVVNFCTYSIWRFLSTNCVFFRWINCVRSRN